MSPSPAVDTAATTVASGGYATSIKTAPGPVVVTTPIEDATTSVITKIQSAVSGTASLETTTAIVAATTGNFTRTASVSTTSIVYATGAAAPAKGYKKMGFAGALAGAAGVMFV
jgi:hypothetical protein